MNPTLRIFRTAGYFWIALLLPISAGADSALRMDVHNNQLTLSARNADLKSIMRRLAEETGIAVRYPRALDKKVTVELSDVALERGLRRILKGLNYATVYLRPDDSERASISKVFIFKAYQGPRRTSRNAGRRTLIEDRIANYQKRFQSAQRRLNQVAPDSPAGQRLQRQIRSYQRVIERLEQQIN